MDEAQLEGLEEARKGQMEVAQEEDAPPEEGPEAPAGMRPKARRPDAEYPGASPDVAQGPDRQSTIIIKSKWEHGVVASLRAPVKM